MASLLIITACQDKKNEEVSLSELTMENAEALTGDINPMCPDGCLTDPGSCKCNGPHPYLEATWPDTDDNVPED